MTESVWDRWRARLRRAEGDAELARLAPGLNLTVAFEIGKSPLTFGVRGGILVAADGDAAQVTVLAESEAWARCLEDPAPPGFHAFTAWEMANPAFSIVGDPLIRAQGRAALERIVELALAPELRPTRLEPPRDLTQITGRTVEMRAAGGTYDVFYETAGEGLPILFLHTAGADARQFRAQLADPELAARFRMVAPDLPFHGRSMPPRDWGGAAYRLSAVMYFDWCQNILTQIIREPAIVVGGSMGAAMALVLAAEVPQLLRGVVALEPPFRSRGRRSPWQSHVAVHGGLHNGAFVRGLMSPTSPETDRRAAAWIYSQGAPGIYPGDLAFYSEEFDGAEVAPRIDASVLPIALLSGIYDYSASPEDGARLAAMMPGALHIVMEKLGHFPMCEDPGAFRPHLLEALGFVVGVKGPSAS